MSPKFPNFKKIELSDRALIESFTENYPPYSDYNFTSLWCWNTKDKTEISEFDGNLVVRFTDYLTGKPFYSFLGPRPYKRTVQKLLQFIEGEGLPPVLRLLPEHCIRRLKRTALKVEEDPDNFDYILAIKELVTYQGRSWRGKRNFVNRFRKQYQSTTSEIDIADSRTRKSIQKLFLRWAEQKKLEAREVENESTALRRLLHAAQSSSFVAIGVFISDRLIGFSVNEVVAQSYAVLHFEKADVNSFVGVYPYVMQETARELAARGCRYLNYEQDLGLPGLRKAKESYHPCHLLKKYILTGQE